MLLSAKTLERHIRFINDIAMKFPFFRRIVDPERRFGMETAKLLVLLKEGEENISRLLRQELEKNGLPQDEAQAKAKRIMGPFPVMSWVLNRAKRHGISADAVRAIRRFSRDFNAALRESLRAPFQRLPQGEASFQSSFEPRIRPDEALTHGRRIYSAVAHMAKELRPLATGYKTNGVQDIYSDLNRMEDDAPLVRAHRMISREVRTAFRLSKRSEADQIATETLKLFVPHLADTPPDDPEHARFFAESIRAMAQVNDITTQLKHHKFPGRNEGIAAEVSLLRNFDRALTGMDKELAAADAPGMIDNYLDGIGVNNLYYRTPIVRNVIDFPRPPHSAHKARLEMMQLGDMALTYGFGDSTTNGFGYDFSSAFLPQIEAGRLTLMGLGIFTQDRPLVELQRSGAAALAKANPSYTPERIAALESLYFKYGTYSNHDFVHVSFEPVKFAPNIAWSVAGNEKVYRDRLTAEWRADSLDMPLLKQQLGMPKNTPSADIIDRLEDPAFLQTVVDTPVARAVLGRGLTTYNEEWSLRLNTRFFSRSGLQAEAGNSAKDHLVIFKDKAAFFGMAGLELWSMMTRTEMFHRELGYERGKPMAEQTHLVPEKLAEYTGEIAAYMSFVHDRTQALAAQDPARARDAYLMAGNDLREFVYQSMWVIPPDVIQIAVDAFTRAHPDFSFPVRHPGAYGHYDDSTPEKQMTMQELLDVQRQDWTGQIHDLTTVNIFDAAGNVIAEKTPMEIVADFAISRARLVTKQAINELLGLRYEPVVPSDALSPFGTLDRIADFIRSAPRQLAQAGIDTRAQIAAMEELKETLLALDAAFVSVKPVPAWRMEQAAQALENFGASCDRLLDAAAQLNLDAAAQPYNIDRDIVRNQISGIARALATPGFSPEENRLRPAQEAARKAARATRPSPDATL